MERFNWKYTIRRNILVLKIMGLWPQGDESYKFNLYAIYAIISITMFILGPNFFQLVNIIFISNDLETITGTIFITLPEILVIFKSYYVIRNMRILKQLMITLDSDIFQPRNVRQIKLIEPDLKFWKNVSISLSSMCSGAVFFWSTFPILDKSVKDHRLPFLAWFPFNTKISPLYEITYLYQVLGSAFLAATALSIGMLIAALNMYVGAQCDILCDDLRHLHEFTEPNEMNNKLVSCIKHHNEILRFAANSNNFFNWIVFLQFFTSAASIGITMYLLTVVAPFSSEFYSHACFVITITVEIFMFCWFGNEVEIKSSNIPYAAFEFDWTDTSLEVKKNLIFFIMRTQKPIKMSALNLFYLSLQTFTRILRTSYSYFALLNQVSS